MPAGRRTAASWSTRPEKSRGRRPALGPSRRGEGSDRGGAGGGGAFGRAVRHYAEVALGGDRGRLGRLHARFEDAPSLSGGTGWCWQARASGSRNAATSPRRGSAPKTPFRPSKSWIRLRSRGTLTRSRTTWGRTGMQRTRSAGIPGGRPTCSAPGSTRSRWRSGRGCSAPFWTLTAAAPPEARRLRIPPAAPPEARRTSTRRPGRPTGQPELGREKRPAGRRLARGAARPACAAGVPTGRPGRGSACRAQSRKGEQAGGGIRSVLQPCPQARGTGRKGAGRGRRLCHGCAQPAGCARARRAPGSRDRATRRGTQESRPGAARRSAKSRKFAAARRAADICDRLIENFSFCLAEESAAAWRQTAFTA